LEKILFLRIFCEERIVSIFFSRSITMPILKIKTRFEKLNELCIDFADKKFKENS